MRGAAYSVFTCRLRGYGYLNGAVVERLYRDARFAELAYGTSEMQRAFIAKDSLDRFQVAL